MSTYPAVRRPSLWAIVRWTCALVAFGLLAVALLSLPFQLYAVRTGSMEPTFGPRALVVVHKNELVLGQPISFAHNGDVITHRLVSVNADGTLVTRGDANETPDPWVV
jgi:signal peptidase